MRDKKWDIGRRCIAGAAACMLGIGIFLGTGSAQDVPSAASVPSASAPQEETAEAPAVSKDEIIYGLLSAQGKVEELYAVNHFVTLPGTRITDYGTYTQVENLTTVDPVTRDENTVTFTAQTDNFYYQGDLKDKDLPWDFTITYSLDGKKIPPEELAGKGGHLEIHLTAAPDGETVFTDNYMLQMQVTLNTDLVRNIRASGGTQASAGISQVIAYTVLPGKEAAYTLEADVEDFEMTGIQITAMPYTAEIEFPDIEDSLSGLDALPQAIAEIDEGVGKIEDGTQDMRSGARQLQNGSGAIRKGLSLLASSGSALKSGSRQVKGGLDRIASSLADSGFDSLDLSAVSALPAGLGQLEEGLRGLSGGLSELRGGFSTAYSALESAVDTIPAPSVSQEEIEGLISRQTDPADAGLIGVLAQNYQAAQTVRGTFSQIRSAFDAVAPALDEAAAGLDEMASRLSSAAEAVQGQLGELDRLPQLRELTAGLRQLSSSYSELDAGLAKYTAGVSELSSQYGTFDAGLASFAGGTGELYSGVRALHDGTRQLSDEIAGLPEMIQDEIDRMKEEYLPEDFVPVSFTSGKNKDTVFVQFVLQCDGISLPEEEGEEGTAEEAEETFWDRLAALFA